MYRHLEIAAAAPLRDVGDGTYRLGLDAPPPVRTVLSIHSAEGARAYEVVSVVEVAADASARGCILRAVDADRLPTTVGTEKLRGGALGSAEPASTTSTASTDAESEPDAEGYGAHMAVPAPVVSEDSSEPIDVGDNDENGSAEPASEETPTPGDGASRGKKRRGRNRR
jgi:hypothetical protein